MARGHVPRTEPMGHRAPSHSKQPCPGTRGSAWVDETMPLLLVGTNMDDSNTKISQNNDVSVVNDVKVEDHRTETPEPDAKRCKVETPIQETGQQKSEGCSGAQGMSAGPSTSQPIQEVKTERSSPTGGGKRSRKRKFQQCVPLGPNVKEDRASFPSFRFMNVKIKLGLCAADHPHVFLTTFQLETLAQLILNAILGPEGQRVKPRFYGITMNHGHLILVCGDYATASWVHELPEKLLLGDVRLKVVQRPVDIKTFVAVGRFPKSEHEPVERILKFLQNQNEGLDCSLWKVLDRNRERGAVRLTISIDWASAQLLKAKGPLLNYKFAKAKFMVKTKKGVNFEEEDYGHGDLDYKEAFPVMDEFVDPYAETKPFDYQYGSPWINPLSYFYPEDVDYARRVGAVVRKAETTLKNGCTSRQRYRHRVGKRKKKKGNANPS